jgi:hypothetical protein
LFSLKKNGDGDLLEGGEGGRGKTVAVIKGRVNWGGGELCRLTKIISGWIGDEGRLRPECCRQYVHPKC